MSVQNRRVLWRFVIFGMMGLLCEVFQGSVWAARHGNWNLRGGTSPWMIFDYGLLGIALMPMARPLIRRRVPLPARALVYMVCIFAVEFVSGWLFDICGLEIWNYKNFKYNLRGYITPQFIPGWYFMGLVAEYLYRRVDAASLVLAARLKADRVESMMAEAETET